MTPYQFSGPARWVGIAALGTAVEAIALHTRDHDATLSYAARSLFCTDKAYGRVAFVLAWAALSVWLVPHVVTGSLTPQEDSQ